ncbi:site-specific DNA-methyltransferase [bacterium]|nr:site-specific DNA-methyltransferase [bacterium]
MSKDQLREDMTQYPRDPALDPQLVWKGKTVDPLEVGSVPIYIQEKIHPQAIVDDIVKRGKKPDPRDDQVSLFDDFNGLDDKDKKIDFYNHEQHWTNRMILGDSLLVMNSLIEREHLRGKVQMIYIDPPYGIKFGSNWQVSTRKRDVKDGSVSDATRQPEQVKAFRDTWELGIHSYLSYLRDRLMVARELLTESGSVFVQIGDENLHLIRAIMDEEFGSENFCSLIPFAKTSAATSDILSGVFDLLVWYAKDRNSVKYRPLYSNKVAGKSGGSGYTKIKLSDGTERTLNKNEKSGVTEIPKGSRYFATGDITSPKPPGDYPVNFEGKIYHPVKGYWKTNEQGFRRLICADRVRATSGKRLSYLRYLDDFPAVSLNNLWHDTLGQNQFGGSKTYAVQTALSVVQRALLMTTDPGDLVLDPTCGSGTTAYVAEQWGRRWITIDTSRVALALSRTRLMSSRFPYYTLSDSPEGLLKEAELAGITPVKRTTSGDVRKGFICRSVAHIMLSDIAHNDEIDEIWEHWQDTLESLLTTLNSSLGKSWEEWQVPREAGKDWPDEAVTAHKQWWEARRNRQQEIDASIARNAGSETLYDQPYEDPHKIRVTGPFTVESLSPHRRMTIEESVARAEGSSEELKGVKVKAYNEGNDPFVRSILENLRKAGVQNTKAGERMKLDALDTFPGQYIHAEGEYTGKDGHTRKVAVCIGPEFGTVSSDLVWEAAKEAAKLFDTLLVCGFAFEADVEEEAKTVGRLTVLPVRMNPDLAMGDALLKKTGAGNLFMIFGEPDLDLRHLDDGKLQVEIRGLDIYDPTTGEIRSSSTDDIACWFIDTDYDGYSFFVRHAYFTGADQPYDKLKRALRAEVDEDAWLELYSTVSRPFDPPASGNIAVKVINHYGDEVLKVYKV